MLLYGELPTKAEKIDFDMRVTRHTMVHEQMSRFFTGFRRGPPDGDHGRVCRRVVGLLSRQHGLCRSAPAHVASIRMIAQLPTLAAMAYKYLLANPCLSRNNLDYAAIFYTCASRFLRGLRRQPGTGQGDGPHIHTSLRP